MIPTDPHSPSQANVNGGFIEITDSEVAISSDDSGDAVYVEGQSTDSSQSDSSESDASDSVESKLGNQKVSVL